MKRWILSALLLTVVVALVGGGYIGYGRYADGKIIDGTFASIKNTSLRTANALKLMDASGVTYKELFEKVDADVAEIDKKILDVQTASTPSTQKWMSAVNAYLVASQEVLRAESSMFRKQLSASIARDSYQSAFERSQKAQGSFEARYRADALSDAQKESRIKLMEFQSAGVALSNALGKLGEMRESLTSFVPNDALLDSAIIEAARAKAKEVAG